jgi:uncharacterized protein YkwD
LGAVLALLAVAVAASAAPARVTARATEPPSPDYAASLLAQVNDFRAQNGLPALVSSPVLDQLALQHSEDMLARDYFDHTSPDGVTFDQRVNSVFRKEGYKNIVGRENIALAEGRDDPSDTFQVWLSDEIHKANLLATDTPAVGIGAVYGNSSSGPVTLTTLIEGPLQPQLGTTVLAAVAVRPVLIRSPGATRFVELTTPQVLPVGTEVDTTKGRSTITSVADESGNVQTADFYQGRFVINYVNDAQPHPLRRPSDTTPPPTTPTTPTNPWVTELRLSGPLPVCVAKKQSRLLEKKPKTKPARPTERHLWGNGIGTFRTKGKYAAATVRGTVWLTRDDCTGTLVRVVQGVVDVNDLTLQRHVLVPAGKSYLARKRR